MISTRSTRTETLKSISAGASRNIVAWCVVAGIALTLSATASAASFDCAKAATATEKLICATPDLSVLDEQMADAYRQRLTANPDGQGQLKAEQRAWLRDLRGRSDASSIKSAYLERIEALKNLPTFPAVSEPVNGSTFPIRKASKQFDFTLRTLQHCTDANDTCEAPGQLLVYRKGESKSFQMLDFPVVEVIEPTPGQLLQNSAQLYDYQGTLNIGDFNFDGHDDLAVQTGNQGSYGGPSYDVFLFDGKKQRFVHNDEMTDLIAETLGFFEVDPEKKTIQTFGKGGCCDHVTTTYAVDRESRLVKIAEHEERAVFTEDKPDQLEITDSHLVNGKWKSVVTYEPVPPDH